MLKNKKYLNYLFMVFFAFTAACSQKESDPAIIIAGDTSKKWKTDKETNASGEKQKLDKEEKKETMEFYKNGDFVLDGINKGSWNYDNNSKNLSLQFTGTSVTQNFSVTALEKNKMELVAADGSTMVLNPE